MPNARARTRIITYAVWFRLATSNPRRISYILGELSNSVASTYRLFSDNPNAKQFQDLYWIGDDFYLMHIEEHCSPGDICGFIRGKKLIDGAEEVMNYTDFAMITPDPAVTWTKVQKLDPKTLPKCQLFKPPRN